MKEKVRDEKGWQKRKRLTDELVDVRLDDSLDIWVPALGREVDVQVSCRSKTGHRTFSYRPHLIEHLLKEVGERTISNVSVPSDLPDLLVLVALLVETGVGHSNAHLLDELVHLGDGDGQIELVDLAALCGGFGYRFLRRMKWRGSKLESEDNGLVLVGGKMKGSEKRSRRGME
jgi:hypothetical protein